MIVSLSNFFYYLFTGLSGHFSDSSGIGGIFTKLWLSLDELLFNLGGGGAEISVSYTPDLFETLSVFFAFFLLIGLTLFIVRVIWRLFTLR